eukprot:2056395-Pyramimonas_sp.AAC.1
MLPKSNMGGDDVFLSTVVPSTYRGPTRQTAHIFTCPSMPRHRWRILAITAMIVQSHVLSFFLIDDPFHIYGVAFVMVCISLAVMTRGSH